MKHVSTKEFVRRIIALATKFSQFRLKFSTFYQYIGEVRYDLDKMGIAYKEYYGPYHGSYVEDVYDECIILNPDKLETITFHYCLSNPTPNPYKVTLSIQSEREILKHILEAPIPESCYNLTKNHYLLFKQILDIIYIKYDAIDFIFEKTKKRTYSVCMKDTPGEKIVTDITLNTIRTKKFKIGPTL